MKASSAPVPLLAIDCCLNPLGATLSTFDAIQCLAPFGCDNSEPVFGLMGMTVHAIHAVGASGNTLKLTLRRDDTLLVCLKFSTSIKDFPYQNGDMIDVAVTLKENIYRGNRSLSVIIKDIRPSQIDEEVFFFERAIYEKFAKNETLSEEERKLLIPSREDMATVFRYLKGHSGFRFSTEILYMRLDFKINYAKMLVCLDIMEEFLFISKQFDSVNTLIQFSKSIVKRNFDSSAIIKRLKGRE